MKKPRRFEELIAALKTPDLRRLSEKELEYSTISTRATQARTEAAHQLGESKDARAVEPLIQALEDWSDEVRCAAAWALSEIGDSRACEAIIKTLSRETGHHASNSLRGSWLRLGDARSIKTLIQSLNDEWIAASAVKGLEVALKSEPEKFGDDDLQEIVALKKVVQLQGAWDYREAYMGEQVEIDISRIKELATNELKRRVQAGK
ncbi:MAG: HEAT repeat domain-containing protein [Thermodesulfobacteriota bacterium]